MRQTVIGFFNNASDAQQAAERLRSSGFAEQDIDISTRHSEMYSDTSYNQSSSYRDPANDPTGTYTSTRDVSDENLTAESRTSDYSLNEDRIRDRERRNDDDHEGVGDSIGRFFRNLFDNKEEAEKYSSVGRKSSIVTVYVDSSDQAERAAEILDTCGAVDVDESAREFGNRDESRRDLTSTDERRSSFTADGVTDQSLPVIEENINVGKREVERGGVRLRSRIVERPVEETLRLREEHVRVERNPVNRPATESDFNTFREGEIELTETAEVPIVNKEARVVEEVRLKKDVNEREEVVRDTVRKTDVDVENLSEETLKTRKSGKKKL
jgi:stress response protein YsnF